MGIERIKIPGKVMLSGEYAVLEGGKAVLAPINRFLEIWEDPDNPSVETTPIIGFALNESVPELEEFEEKNGKPNVFVDREEFYGINEAGNKAKLGIGSSAAEAVGVIALRFQRAGFDWKTKREQVAHYAEVAHRKAQDGKGSGADVFTCAIGQPIIFSREKEIISWEVAKIDKSFNIPISLLWTGIPADTRVFVKKFNYWKKSHTKSKPLITGLVEASDSLAESWFRAPQEVLNNQIDVFVSRMQEIAIEAQFEWRLQIHDDISGWIFEQGGRAKPTGAGGGDLVLLVGKCDIADRKELALEIELGK